MIPLRSFTSRFLSRRLSAAAGCALALAGADPAGDPAGSTRAPFAVADLCLPAVATPVDWSATPTLAFPDVATLAAVVWSGHASGAAAGAMTAPPVHGVCEQVAFFARSAAYEAARADYLLEFGKCISVGGGFGSCLHDLNRAYREAVQLAREQYEGRLQVCDLLGSGAYNPDINPRDFSHVVDNRFWPLIPGRTLVYRKTTPEGVEETRVTTLPDTIVIDRVRCAIVRDVVRLGDELVEDTDDWFAQHRNGDVWYMGELARNYEDGQLVDLDGSWRAGTDGALPGVQMLRAPRRGDAYRQEFLLGEAEDLARIVARGVSVTVRAGTFPDCLQTEETTPLEPDAREQKYYAAGIGMVLAVNHEGERTELVQIIDP